LKGILPMALKNITNGSIELDIDPEDKTADNFKFIRMPGGDLYESIRQRDPSIHTNYYI